MSPQIVVLVIALTIGFSVLLDLAVFLLYILTLPAELDVQAPLLDDIDAADARLVAANLRDWRRS